MQDLFFWILAVVIIGLGAYTNYTNWKTFFRSREEKEMFMKNHKDAVIERVTPYRYLMFAALAAVCIVFTVLILSTNPQQTTGASRYSQAALYAGLAIFAIALIPESLMDSRICVCPDGILYETDYIRYKSINKIDIGNGFFKPTTMNLVGNKEVALPKAIAKWLLPRWEEWKINRKNARKKRGRRGV